MVIALKANQDVTPRLGNTGEMFFAFLNRIVNLVLQRDLK